MLAFVFAVAVMLAVGLAIVRGICKLIVQPFLDAKIHKYSQKITSIVETCASPEDAFRNRRHQPQRAFLIQQFLIELDTGMASGALKHTDTIAHLNIMLERELNAFKTSDLHQIKVSKETIGEGREESEILTRERSIAEQFQNLPPANEIRKARSTEEWKSAVHRYAQKKNDEAAKDIEYLKNREPSAEISSEGSDSSDIELEFITETVPVEKVREKKVSKHENSRFVPPKEASWSECLFTENNVRILQSLGIAIIFLSTVALVRMQLWEQAKAWSKISILLLGTLLSTAFGILLHRYTRLRITGLGILLLGHLGLLLDAYALLEPAFTQERSLYPFSPASLWTVTLILFSAAAYWHGKSLQEPMFHTFSFWGWIAAWLTGCFWFGTDIYLLPVAMIPIIYALGCFEYITRKSTESEENESYRWSLNWWLGNGIRFGTLLVLPLIAVTAIWTRWQQVYDAPWIFLGGMYSLLPIMFFVACRDKRPLLLGLVALCNVLILLVGGYLFKLDSHYYMPLVSLAVTFYAIIENILSQRSYGAIFSSLAKLFALSRPIGMSIGLMLGYYALERQEVYLGTEILAICGLFAMWLRYSMVGSGLLSTCGTALAMLLCAVYSVRYFEMSTEWVVTFSIYGGIGLKLFWANIERSVYRTPSIVASIIVAMAAVVLSVHQLVFQVDRRTFSLFWYDQGIFGSFQALSWVSLAWFALALFYILQCWRFSSSVHGAITGLALAGISGCVLPRITSLTVSPALCFASIALIIYALLIKLCFTKGSNDKTAALEGIGWGYSIVAAIWVVWTVWQRLYPDAFIAGLLLVGIFFIRSRLSLSANDKQVSGSFRALFFCLCFYLGFGMLRMLELNAGEWPLALVMLGGVGGVLSFCYRRLPGVVSPADHIMFERFYMFGMTVIGLTAALIVWGENIIKLPIGALWAVGTFALLQRYIGSGSSMNNGMDALLSKSIAAIASFCWALCAIWILLLHRGALPEIDGWTERIIFLSSASFIFGLASFRPQSRWGIVLFICSALLLGLELLTYYVAGWGYYGCVAFTIAGFAALRMETDSSTSYVAQRRYWQLGVLWCLTIAVVLWLKLLVTFRPGVEQLSAALGWLITASGIFIIKRYRHKSWVGGFVLLALGFAIMHYFVSYGTNTALFKMGMVLSLLVLLGNLWACCIINSKQRATLGPDIKSVIIEQKGHISEFMGVNWLSGIRISLFLLGTFTVVYNLYTSVMSIYMGQASWYALCGWVVLACSTLAGSWQYIETTMTGNVKRLILESGCFVFISIFAVIAIDEWIVYGNWSALPQFWMLAAPLTLLLGMALRAFSEAIAGKIAAPSFGRFIETRFICAYACLGIGYLAYAALGTCDLFILTASRWQLCLAFGLIALYSSLATCSASPRLNTILRDLSAAFAYIFCIPVGYLYFLQAQETGSSWGALWFMAWSPFALLASYWLKYENRLRQSSMALLGSIGTVVGALLLTMIHNPENVSQLPAAAACCGAILFWAMRYVQVNRTLDICAILLSAAGIFYLQRALQGQLACNEPQPFAGEWVLLCLYGMLLTIVAAIRRHKFTRDTVGALGLGGFLVSVGSCLTGLYGIYLYGPVIPTLPLPNFYRLDLVALQILLFALSLRIDSTTTKLLSESNRGWPVLFLGAYILLLWPRSFALEWYTLPLSVFLFYKLYSQSNATKRSAFLPWYEECLPWMASLFALGPTAIKALAQSQEGFWHYIVLSGLTIVTIVPAMYYRRKIPLLCGLVALIFVTVVKTIQWAHANELLWPVTGIVIGFFILALGSIFESRMNRMLKATLQRARTEARTFWAVWH